MGEAKRKRDRLTPVEQAALDLTRQMAAAGKLIAAGCAAYLLVRKIEAESPLVGPLHDAYMAGAEHLWFSIMATLDPDTEPTDADVKRMELIASEIEAWRARQQTAFAQAMPTQGSA